jgi:hypothetical protein
LGIDLRTPRRDLIRSAATETLTTIGRAPCTPKPNTARRSALPDIVGPLLEHHEQSRAARREVWRQQNAAERARDASQDYGLGL